ncbi:glycosyltransferase family 4 protein [Williamsia sp. Leaf354]|uniref:glycosyltransferase family 4 protein n=1 Tax=Williamsia sp. Leaf354 TaxID=1736349 RepID=UPI001F475CC4|nr:glycosyltransferase family 4 protein [Williamsia sp. Leaf354]
MDSEVYYRSEARNVKSRQLFNVPQERAVVLFVGYLVQHKGVIDLLDAWDLVRVSADAELWLVGPYGDFYRELDRATGERIRSSHLDYSKNIKLFGALPNKELPLIYCAADVFVLPSYREGMPNSMAEAMMSGCSIVGTRIPGIVDLVRSSHDTKLVDPGDVPALAKAMLSALAHPTQSTPHELQAIDIDSVAATYRDIYRGASQ